MEPDRMAERVREVRDATIREMIAAARRLEAEPDNFDHISQIQFCVQNYWDAQRILDPRFGD